MKSKSIKEEKCICGHEDKWHTKLGCSFCSFARCSKFQPSEEQSKKVSEGELDLIFFLNKLMETYGGIVRRIDKGEDVTWKGGYPSPIDKATGDILDLLKKEKNLAHQQGIEEGKKQHTHCNQYCFPRPNKKEEVLC